MQLSDQQEEFSIAYVHAVAAVAGFGVIVSPRSVDNRGIDLTISAIGSRNLLREPSLHVQVKCTFQDVKREDHLAYPLKAMDHQRLCNAEVTTARILVVVYVPSLLSEWMTHSEDEMVLRYCGYWLSLRGETPTTNEETQTVYLPRTQRFDPSGLQALMTRIDAGEYR